jgi:hypothetical protein
LLHFCFDLEDGGNIFLKCWLTFTGLENVQMDLNRLGEWTVENEMIINPAKSKAVCFTRA